MLVPDLLLVELYKKIAVSGKLHSFMLVQRDYSKPRRLLLWPRGWSQGVLWAQRHLPGSGQAKQVSQKAWNFSGERNQAEKPINGGRDRLNDAHLRGYFNFKTGGSIALDSAHIIMLQSSITCKLFGSWLILDQVPSHGAKSKFLPISGTLICLLMHYS